MLSEDKVLEELKKVIDPELFVNIVDLGLIYGVDIRDAVPRDAASETDGDEADSADADQAESTEGKKDIYIDMTMTSPACPAGPQLISNSKNVVGQLEEVSNVEVKIVMDPPWTPDKMTEDARDQLGIF